MDDLLEESRELERHLGSEMIMEGRDSKTIGGVHVSQEPPLLDNSETVEYAHAVPEPGTIQMRTHLCGI
jgi:hypothetical protein